jgi:hypothetical protein
MNFLSNVLREDGGFEYKKAIVEAILVLIRDIPEAKEQGLAQLCEFIEDCEFAFLSVQILHLLGEEGPRTKDPGGQAGGRAGCGEGHSGPSARGLGGSDEAVVGGSASYYFRGSQRIIRVTTALLLSALLFTCSCFPPSAPHPLPPQPATSASSTTA